MLAFFYKQAEERSDILPSFPARVFTFLLKSAIMSQVTGQ